VGQEYEFAKEFEVWARIIKDNEGRDIHVFRKEDKLRKFRRDSSFYWDGYWEVMEIDSLARSVRSRTSLGHTTHAEHDNKWRLNKFSLVDKNNDTILTEQYFWKDGKLMKTIFNDVERVFIYGKTLQNLVKVIPSDDGLYFHPGYDSSIGMMPDENDPIYEYFVLDPYGSVYVNSESYYKEQTTPVSSMLMRNIGRSCAVEASDLLEVKLECEKRSADEVPAGTPTIFNIPTENGKLVYGKAQFFPRESFGCVYDNKSCKYKINYSDNLMGERIIIEMGYLKYNYNLGKQKWEAYCWSEKDMQNTYAHEAMHIRRARDEVKVLLKKHMPKQDKEFDTQEECVKEGSEGMKRFSKSWEVWRKKEFDHRHEDSPKSTTNRQEFLCQD
jgi:hypothetical protein